MIIWSRVKGPRAILGVIAGTACGAGLFPKAPGTMGALVAVPLAWWSNTWEIGPRLLLWVALTAIGTWGAKVIGDITDVPDNQSIVMDEVVGLGITAWTAGTDWKTLFAAFIAFRFFDIVKPWPVRSVDRWSKKKSAWWGAFGVMADDIVAGFQGLIVIFALQYFKILP